MFIDIFRRLRDAVRRKRPEKWKKLQLVSPSRQCYSTPVGFSQGFLAKDNVTTLEHPPYSFNLDPAEFYPFTRL
jgi:hypothetical protein